MALWRFPKEIISFPNTKYRNDTTKTGFYSFLASLSQIYVPVLRWDLSLHFGALLNRMVCWLTPVCLKVAVIYGYGFTCEVTVRPDLHMSVRRAGALFA